MTQHLASSDQRFADAGEVGEPVDAGAVVLGATAAGLFIAPFAYAAIGGPHIGGGIGCLARQAVGIPCPFCGLTTSFTFAASGRFDDAFAVAPFGPILWALCGIAAVWLAVTVLRRQPLHRPRAVPAALLRRWWVWAPVLVTTMWVWQYFRVVVWRWYV